MHPENPVRKIAILSGGWDRPYTFGLTNALICQGVRVELVAGDDLSAEDFGHPEGLRILNLRTTNAPNEKFVRRLSRLLTYYVRLMVYAFYAEPRIFHILWNNGHDLFDRVVLTSYYRLLGRTVILTVHNVNAGVRDNDDTWINRMTLRFQYRHCHHLFVHTEEMKRQLSSQFGIIPDRVTVIPFGVNDAVPRTEMTPTDARRHLGVSANERVLLFFGNILPYKGLEYLVRALPMLLSSYPQYRLIIAGRVSAGHESYWEEIRSAIDALPDRSRVLLRTAFIPDRDVEIYFKSADLLVLPYVHIFQSGVLFLGLSFGVPAVVTDVGSLRSEVTSGESGLCAKPKDAVSLAAAVENYFASPLASLDDISRRTRIIDYVNCTHSWKRVSELTLDVYAQMVTFASNPWVRAYETETTERINDD